MPNNLNSINLHDPLISKNSKKYILECLNTGWISSSGNFVNIFEKNLSKILRSKYSVATTNGTAALHLSLIASEIEINDEIIVPSMTFIATVNVIKYVNANPIFMDCDKFLNIDTDKTIDFLDKYTELKLVKRLSGKKKYLAINKKTKKPISAIIVTHNYGNAVYLDKLISVCKKKNINIIEDAAESLGTIYKRGKFKNKYTGTIGNVGCLSFNGNKILSTGAGGMILTNNLQISKKTKYLSLQAKDNSIRYIHHQIGYNYSITNLQAAFGLAQIESLSSILKIKNEIHNIYLDIFYGNNKFEIMKTPNYAYNNNWLNILKINNYDKYDTNLLHKKLRKYNIESRPVWFPIHLQTPYKKYQKYKISKSINAPNIYLCLPSGFNIKKNEIKKIYEVLNG